jgi:hypothetical protein
MRIKWYASTLFLIFIYLGAFHEKVTIPNQEIVLEFVDTKIKTKEIKNTIANVKEKLKKVGVSNITIEETKDGTLKISYYSKVGVKNVKKAFAKDFQFLLNQDSENNKNDYKYSDYNIDIYELSDNSDLSNFDNNFILEIKYSSERFTTNHSNIFLRNLELQKANQLYKTAYNISKNNPFTKDYTSYNEPEVRAGPIDSFI